MSVLSFDGYKKNGLIGQIYISNLTGGVTRETGDIELSTSDVHHVGFSTICECLFIYFFYLLFLLLVY